MIQSHNQSSQCTSNSTANVQCLKIKTGKQKTEVKAYLEFAINISIKHAEREIERKVIVREMLEDEINN